MVDNQDLDTDTQLVPVETDEKPLTSKQFNQALSAREKAFEKRLIKQQDDFNKIMQGYLPPPKDEPALSRTSELEKTVKELSKQLQDRDAREKTNNLRKAAEQSLKAHGIDSEFSEHALAYLVDAKQAIKYDSDGNLIMVLNGIEYDSIDEGMTVWAQSRDAKLYKKPTAAQGSGDTNRKNVSSAIEQMNKTGQLDIKRREGWAEKFDPQDPKSSLDKNSRVALSQLLAQKLSIK